MVQVRKLSQNLENDPSTKFGQFLANPSPGDEIVISGMSGAFPLSSNIDEFKHNLDTKTEMITIKPSTHPEMPPGFGKLKDEDVPRFDTGFFEIHQRHALTMGPICKWILEKTYEAIFDAGLHPSDLEGTNTGVFLGVCFTEAEIHWYRNEHIKGGNAIIGNIKDVFANRISQMLKLKGPSLVCDTACSSSGYALESAYKAIRMGQCDTAIVSAGNMIMSGGCSLQFARLGVLSPTGHCRPFDEDGIGYVRSEAVITIILQKAKNSKRIYAQVVHTKTNCDGYKEQGITYPSGQAQLKLLKEIYTESEVNPTEIGYIEAHGTGTIVGDPEELNSIDEFFTPGRSTPLLVGSVKSSIGHSEPASLLCSLVKVLLAFETDIVSPNVNYEKPRKNIPGIIEGRLEVVVENTQFRDQNGLAGVSSFGFGGANTHLLIKRHGKTRSGQRTPMDDYPRLVCVSGRTEHAIHVLLQDVEDKFDEEHIALIQNVFRRPIVNHIYRGYTIVSKKGASSRSVKLCGDTNRKIMLSFGGLSKKHGNLLVDLLTLPLLTQFGRRITDFWTSKKIDINTILSNSTSSSLAHFLSGMLTQLCIAELLKQLEVRADLVIAHSFGHLTSAYYDNRITLKECLACIFTISNVSCDIEVNKAGISVEGFTRFKSKALEDLKQIMPNHIHRRVTPEFLVEAILETSQHEDVKLHKNSVVVQIGQGFLPLTKRRGCRVLNLDNPTDFNGVLEVFGKLFELGGQPQIHKLYPQVQFPVSRGTPMISSKIKWNHDKVHFIPCLENYSLGLKGAMKFSIGLNDEEWSTMDGHIIDGRNLFPATGYLYLAWTALGEMLSCDLTKLKAVFENCRFMRACSLPRRNTGKLDLEVTIQNKSGNFEITEGGVVVVSGIIKVHDNLLSTSPTAYTNGDDDYSCSGRDVYKELRLRGYNYKGQFKSIVQCNQSATRGKIKWQENWIAFMDNMLQMKILGEDTRLLYVPTSIARLSIDPETHLDFIETLRHSGESVEVPVKVSYQTGIIKSGGVEVWGLLASSIPRKKTTALPVLEKYQFVANECKLELKSAIRVFMQIALENNCELNVKVVEVIDEACQVICPPIGPMIRDALGDLPLVHSDVLILSSQKLDLDVTIEDAKLRSQSDCTVVVGTGLLHRSSVMEDALSVSKQSSFIITRESLSLDLKHINIPSKLILSCVIDTPIERLVLLHRNPYESKTKMYVQVDTRKNKFEWLNPLKEAVKKDLEVVVWCQNDPLSGIIGLVNCIRKEPDCQNVRCMFIIDASPVFNPDDPFYKNQLNKNMGINVLKDGKWGTYRHLLLDNTNEMNMENCYAGSTIRGDLSSIKWIEGPLRRQGRPADDDSLVEVYYSSLNFRDVMTASGRINVDVITKNRREQECVQGFEFSGKTLDGRRVMGMVNQGSLATMIKSDSALLWDVPEKWSLKDAATVPVVYGTCLYALVVTGKMKPGDYVLIHSGTGGVGQAAINVCLDMGCTVFTTVGTAEKRKFITRNFPKIDENHIGNSRDVSFEQMIMQKTNGRGVDIILNSLSEEKLFASVRCLSKNGRFLEIGKFDLANDNHLTLLPFCQGGSYHGVMLDKLFSEPYQVRMKLNDLLQKFIDSGTVKPLKATVFDRNEVEQAFRYMTTGKHMGKVLVEIRQEDVQSHSNMFKGLPRYYCDSAKTYIICGGLGGFGLELADWLILRGAKNVVLTSRKGVSTGYQNYRIGIWTSYGCNIMVSTQDITTRTGCQNLIKEASGLGSVAAIFNLAVVLRDAILENQTTDSFEMSFGPKAYATQFLDEVTRKHCHELRDFVIFSSVSCGKGNAGQTNYGMSNSVMERICEARRRDGLPGLAIQWGAIGDVGLVAEMQEDHVELEIGGTLQQNIANCLQVIDVLMRQTQAAIVSSIVVAEKKSSISSGNIMEVISGILGIRDIKSVSLTSTLAELGMDSMTGVEVKQTLEREYNIFLSSIELRSVTLVRIQEMYENGANPGNSTDNCEDSLNWTALIQNLLETDEQKSSIIKLRSLVQHDKHLPRVIAFPGIEGVCEFLQNLTINMGVEAYGINYISDKQATTIEQMADQLLPQIKTLLQPYKPFHILAHSVGSNVAVEVLQRLEKEGYIGNVYFLDGSSKFLKELISRSVSGDLSDAALDNMFLTSVLRIHLNQEETVDVMNKISRCGTLDDKLQLLNSNMKPVERLGDDFYVKATMAGLKRLKACTKYNPTCQNLKSKAFLYKPTLISVKVDSEDYELSQHFDKPVVIKVIEGTHTSILKNQELADDIMKQILTVDVITKV